MDIAGKRAKRVFEVGPRIYFPQALCADERYILTGDQHRHVSQVLRLKAGAALTLFDGTGGEYAAVIEEVNRANSSVRTGEYRSVDKESPLQLRLAQDRKSVV